MARVAITGDYYGAGATVDAYGSDAADKYIDKKFSKNVLLQYYNDSTAVMLTNTDYEGEIKQSGDSVVIRKDPTVAINDYTIGGTISYEVLSEAAQTLIIDQAKVAAFKINTIDDLQSDIGLPNRFQNAAAENMRDTIDKEVLYYMAAGSGTATSPATTLVNAKNYGLTAGEVSASTSLGVFDSELSLDSDTIHSWFVNLGTVLAEARIGDTKAKWAVMNPFVAAYLQTSDLKRADVTNDSKGSIRTGIIGQVAGLDLYVTNNAFNYLNTATARCFSILAGCNEFASFAAQITESDILPIQNEFGKYYRTLNVYGRKVVQDTAAALLVCKK